MTSQPPKVFISYAREDAPYKEQLTIHLEGLAERGVLSSWHDGLLVPGQQWDGEIVKQLDSSRIILLLVSSDFIASGYINRVELKRASERCARGEMRVIPVLVRNVHGWQDKPFGQQRLGEFNALPGNLEFIVDWKNPDAAYADIVKGVEETAENLQLPAGAAGSRPFIPRPPVFGFVARRDAEGRDLVGRLKDELAPHRNQLATLSGPGGVGKTTLAAEAARELKEAFAGRLVWSSAAARADFALSTLLDETATQLGRPDLRTLAPAAKDEQVAALVSDPPALVVLDNYETIAPDAKKVIESWFARAQCSALLTSRHQIAGTLNVPVAAMSPEEAREFLDKVIAQAQDPQIFSDEVRRSVYETAEANPFVMQWVVGQIDAAQEPRAVLEELQHGEGDAAQRVFDRSFNLPQVGDDGRAALLALSLFVPSATREALAEVAGFGDDSKRVNEAVKNLRALWLIRGIDENRRFTVEGLTRSLARARLSKDACAVEFRQRFVAHFLRYAEAHEQPTPEDYDAMEAERDNLLGAMDAAFASQDWQSVQRMAYALAAPGMLYVRGYWDEALRRNEQALEAARLAQDERGVASFAHNAAVIYQDRGELAEARRLYGESLEITKRLGDQSFIAITSHQLAMLAQAEGDIEEARRLYGESLEINKRLDNQGGIANTLGQLGSVAYGQGDPAEARRLYGECADIFRRLGDQSGTARILHELGRLAQGQGELAEARRLYGESLEITKRLGDRNTIAATSRNLGLMAEREGDKAEAARLFREALRIFEKLGSPYAEAARRDLARVGGDSS